MTIEVCKAGLSAFGKCVFSVGVYLKPRLLPFPDFELGEKWSMWKF